MKKFLLCAFFALLAACSSQKDSAETETSKQSETVLKWISAGLSVDLEDAENSGAGIEAVLNVGDFLFARNDRHVEGRRSPQLFMGKVASLLWKELTLPEGDIPSVLFADSQNLYVGTFFSHRGARLWKFSPQRESWNLLPIPQTDTSYGVDGIAKFHGRLVLSLSNGKSKNSNPIFFENSDGTWTNRNRGFPKGESFLRAVEWKGELFAMTFGNGVYRFNPQTEKWKSLPVPSVRCEDVAWNDSSLLARDAAITSQNLLVGYANLEGVFEFSPNGAWKQNLNCALKNSNGNSELISKTPASVYRFIPFNDQLIALGEGSAVYSPQENRWQNLPPISGASEIFDGVIARDTLYVAAFNQGVMKLPTSNIKTIQNRNEVIQ